MGFISLLRSASMQIWNDKKMSMKVSCNTHQTNDA
jgi:hypothetical protein